MGPGVKSWNQETNESVYIRNIHGSRCKVLEPRNATMEFVQICPPCGWSNVKHLWVGRRLPLLTPAAISETPPAGHEVHHVPALNPRNFENLVENHNGGNDGHVDCENKFKFHFCRSVGVDRLVALGAETWMTGPFLFCSGRTEIIFHTGLSVCTSNGHTSMLVLPQTRCRTAQNSVNWQENWKFELRYCYFVKEKEITAEKGASNI